MIKNETIIHIKTFVKHRQLQIIEGIVAGIHLRCNDLPLKVVGQDWPSLEAPIIRKGRISEAQNAANGIFLEVRVVFHRSHPKAGIVEIAWQACSNSPNTSKYIIRLENCMSHHQISHDLP
jgi:hypothetical protein